MGAISPICSSSRRWEAMEADLSEMSGPSATCSYSDTLPTPQPQFKVWRLIMAWSSNCGLHVFDHVGLVTLKEKVSLFVKRFRFHKAGKKQSYIRLVNSSWNIEDTYFYVATIFKGTCFYRDIPMCFVLTDRGMLTMGTLLWAFIQCKASCQMPRNPCLEGLA